MGIHNRDNVKLSVKKLCLLVENIELALKPNLSCIDPGSMWVQLSLVYTRKSYISVCYEPGTSKSSPVLIRNFLFSDYFMIPKQNV